MLVMLVALNAFLWTMTGFSLCWATHRQRGLEYLRRLTTSTGEKGMLGDEQPFEP